MHLLLTHIFKLFGFLYLCEKYSCSESVENLSSVVQTNISREDEKVKIPLYNKDQIQISYDDLMDLLDKAPSVSQAFDDILNSSSYQQTELQNSLKNENPYFPKVLPKLTYDAEKNLILTSTCLKGNENSITDIGEGRLAIQVLAPDYEDAFNSEISRYLSGVFQVSRKDILVVKGFRDDERKIIITAKAISQINPLYRILSVIRPATEENYRKL
uniref:Uncharacterized protein n=1 Tax=Clastoptera arizonana TaxID=38151 RepID=A0A1B6E271_9HEMI